MISKDRPQIVFKGGQWNLVDPEPPYHLRANIEITTRWTQAHDHCYKLNIKLGRYPIDVYRHGRYILEDR